MTKTLKQIDGFCANNQATCPNSELNSQIEKVNTIIQKEKKFAG